MNNVGRNLKLTRQEMGYTINDLSRITQIKPTLYKDYESGKKPIPLDTLEKIADLFGVELHIFFSENEKTLRQRLADDRWLFTKENNIPEKDIEEIAKFKNIARQYVIMNKITKELTK
jgi:transcriptional regulator with XRE-family HTH domain